MDSGGHSKKNWNLANDQCVAVAYSIRQICLRHNPEYPGAHANSARDGDRPGGGSDNFRRHQLHCPNGPLARRALALRRVSAPRRAYHRSQNSNSFAPVRALPSNLYDRPRRAATR